MLIGGIEYRRISGEMAPVLAIVTVIKASDYILWRNIFYNITSSIYSKELVIIL